MGGLGFGQSHHRLSYVIFSKTTTKSTTERLIVAEKYCHLVEKEGGLELLKELTLHPDPPVEVKKLAAIVLDNSYKYKHHDWQQELDG